MRGQELAGCGGGRYSLNGRYLSMDLNKLGEDPGKMCDIKSLSTGAIEGRGGEMA